MEQQKKSEKSNSLSAQLRNLMFSIIIPLCLIFIGVLVFLIFSRYQYNEMFDNISGASQFNQDFKSDIDLKMYYFVIESTYADGLPIDEVQVASDLAKNLSLQSKSSEGAKAIASVIDLCDNLITCMYEIEATEDYDTRMALLESNVYIITELIQDYVYIYLRHEASYLASIQEVLNAQLEIELILSIISFSVLVALSLRQALSIHKDITKPIIQLSHRAKEIGEGAFSPKTPICAQDPDLHLLGQNMENMVSQINELVIENQQEQQRLRTMELTLLQAQVNPHFLYNTLDAIVWLIEMEKNDEAVNMVTSLSDYFRSSLSQGKDIITIHEEELHIRSYLAIQKVRYKDILNYEVDIADDVGEYMLPKLTLQPLVENALYHGIKSKRGGGKISVNAVIDNSWILLEVRDTGAGMTAERLAEVRASLKTGEAVGFGVVAVCRRLQLLYNENCHIEISSVADEGTLFSIRIPKQL